MRLLCALPCRDRESAPRRRLLEQGFTAGQLSYPQDRGADRPPSVGLWIILGEVLEQVVPAQRGDGA
jgi:hypothetical protein